MPRTRRYIQPGRPYELILRVREGLPFRPGPLINTLLEGIIARAQRDHKVTLCHYIWMSNHAHIILIPHCPQSCVNFYQEVQKKITDTFKRLLGKRTLRLWEGDAVLAQILDVEKAIDRVAYLYANPARANLVDSIVSYSGSSSWRCFTEAKPNRQIPWIQLPMIPRLKTLTPTKRAEERILSEVSATATLHHTLNLEPAALATAFGIDGDLKEQILKRVRDKELEANNKRIEDRKSVLKTCALFNQRIFAPHLPKRKAGERRIFVFSSIKELRLSFIYALKEFCSRCADCYQLLRCGATSIDWPSYAFRPFAPPIS